MRGRAPRRTRRTRTGGRGALARVGMGVLAATAGAALALGTPLAAPAATLGAEPGPVRSGREPRAVALASVERVRIVDFAFRPRRLEIPRGTRVRWVNRGEVSHTTTSTTGVWDSGVLQPGETFGRVFRSRGTFRYRCTIHTDMTGKVVVT